MDGHGFPLMVVFKQNGHTWLRKSQGVWHGYLLLPAHHVFPHIFAQQYILLWGTSLPSVMLDLRGLWSKRGWGLRGWQNVLSSPGQVGNVIPVRQSLCRICVAEGRSLFISWDGLNKNCPLVLVFLAGYSGFPGGSDSRESSCNVGDLGLIPGVGRSPGGGHGNLLQCSGLENPHLRRHLQATVHGVAKSLTWLSD